jgi:hypothetical protein
MIRDHTLQIVLGFVRREAVSVYSVIHNEMFFLPAFLDHYRSLGAQQFLFVYDRSTDDTLAFLAGQSDCVVLHSSVRYGEFIDGQRAGHVWKNEVPHRFFLGKWAICVDADEFLHIPSGFSVLPQFLEALDARGLDAVAAVMIDCYPEALPGFSDLGPPETAKELAIRYPWFDRGPYIRWSTGEINGGVRERLFKQYGISTRSYFKSSWTVLARRIRNLFGGDRNIQSIHKIPLVKWRSDRYYEHSHTLNSPPANGLLLALAHYKFTGVLHQKIEHAVASGAYSGNSRLYHGYHQLLECMRQTSSGFLGVESEKFTSSKDFENAKLMWCDFGPTST